MPARGRPPIVRTPEESAALAAAKRTYKTNHQRLARSLRRKQAQLPEKRRNRRYVSLAAIIEDANATSTGPKLTRAFVRGRSCYDRATRERVPTSSIRKIAMKGTKRMDTDVSFSKRVDVAVGRAQKKMGAKEGREKRLLSLSQTVKTSQAEKLERKKKSLKK